MSVWTTSKYFLSLRQYSVLTTSQTLYHRRVRDKNCIVGTQPKIEDKVVKACACIESDFEWCVHTSHGLGYFCNISNIVNSTTSRMMPGNVFSSLALHRYQMTIPVETAETTGMSEPHTAKSHIRAVKTAYD